MNLFAKTLFLSSLATAANLALADHPTVTLDKGNASPVTAVSAVPLEQGSFGFSLRSEAIFNQELSDTELLNVDGVHSVESVTSTALFGAYGLTDDLTFGFSLPHTSFHNIREAGHHDDGSEGHGHGHGHSDGHGGEEAEGQVESLGDSEGLGDVVVFGQYRFFENAASDLHAALLFGLETPTGRTGERGHGGERFETEHQPGSGSWDPLVGLAVTRQLGRLSVDTSAIYTFVTEGARDTDIGDGLAYNLAFSWRLSGGADCSHEPAGDPKNLVTPACVHGPICDLIFEFNGDWRDKVDVAGVADPNTGGNVIYATGGARLSWASGWSAFGAAGLPIVEDLNGIQSEPDVRVLFGISRAF